MTLVILATVSAILPGVDTVTHIDPQPYTSPLVRQAATQLEQLQAVEDRRRRRRHHRRRSQPPMRTALASYYTDHGTGACGVGDVQSGYRFASLFLSCGARVRFCYRGRCVEGVMSDHGPYVSGRTFDLNLNLKDALGCSDLCTLLYRLG
jgi:hypothetical protein